MSQTTPKLSLINDTLDRKRIRKNYEENSIIQIENFFSDAYAERLYNFFYHQISKDGWCCVTYPNPNPNPDKTIYNVYKNRYLPDAQENIEQGKKTARDVFKSNSFAYIFDVTRDHAQDTCNCVECQLRQYLASAEVLEFIHESTGEKVTHPLEIMVTRYRQGGFLAPHRDANKGGFGFVYSLTKGWRVEWGGNLHFLNPQDWTLVERVIVPKYNLMTIFSLNNNQGKPHFVSEVSHAASTERISVAGWYQ